MTVALLASFPFADLAFIFNYRYVYVGTLAPKILACRSSHQKYANISTLWSRFIIDVVCINCSRSSTGRCLCTLMSAVAGSCKTVRWHLLKERSRTLYVRQIHSSTVYTVKTCKHYCLIYPHTKHGGNMGFKLDWSRKVWRERTENFCYKTEGKKNKYAWIEKVKLTFRFFFLEGRRYNWLVFFLFGTCVNLTYCVDLVSLGLTCLYLPVVDLGPHCLCCVW